MRKSQVVLAVFILMLFLAGCPGNGGASHSGGAVYTGGAAPEDSNTSYSAQDILNLSNADEIEAMIELLTSDEDEAGTGSGSPATVAVTFDASDIGLPEGGRVTITMTVDGEQTVLRATADEDGKVNFDIPAVPTNSRVTVRMDVENATGILLATGTAEKTVTDDDSAFALTLKSMMDQTVTYTGSQTEQVDIISSGNETIYVTLKDFILTAASSSSAFAIRNSHPGTVTTVYVDIQGSVRLAGGNHGGFKLCTNGNPGGTINVIFLSSSSGTLEFSYQSGADGSLQIEHLTGSSFTVMDGCTVSGMQSGASTSSMTSYSDWNGFLSATQSKRVSRFTISKD